MLPANPGSNRTLPGTTGELHPESRFFLKRRSSLCRPVLLRIVLLIAKWGRSSRAFSYRFLSFSKLLVSEAMLALLLVQISPCCLALSADSSDRSQAVALDSRVGAVLAYPPTLPTQNGSARTHASVPPTYREPRLSVGVRGGLSLGEHDLKLTTNRFPNYYAGVHGQFRIGESHFLRPVGEWWNFSSGVQVFQDNSQIQTIRTHVQAVVFGGEYLYGLGGHFTRISLGAGAYGARWSVDSVNVVTLFAFGTVQASGNSHWTRPAGGALATCHLSHRFELMGRWVYSTYGFERVPVSVVTFGAGWSFR